MLRIALALLCLVALPLGATDWGRYAPNPAGILLAQAPAIEPPPSPPAGAGLAPRKPVSEFERRLHLANDPATSNSVPRTEFVLPHGLRHVDPPKPYTPKPGEIYFPPPPGLPVTGPIGGRP